MRTLNFEHLGDDEPQATRIMQCARSMFVNGTPSHRVVGLDVASHAIRGLRQAGDPSIEEIAQVLMSAIGFVGMMAIGDEGRRLLEADEDHFRNLARAEKGSS